MHRYIIKEFLGAFSFGLTVFSVILILDQLFQLVDLFLSKGVPFLIVAKLFLLVLPNIFSLTIPMAVLFGALISYGRLAEDNEITVMRATGTNYKHLSVPILAVVLLLSGFLIYFNHILSPSMYKNFRNIYQDILTKSPLVKFEERGVTNVGDYKLYAQKADRETNVLQGVNIYRFGGTKNKAGIGADISDSDPWRIAASSATVTVTTGAVVMRLYNGYWQRTNPSDIASMVYTTFNSYQFAIPLDDKLNSEEISLREMPSSKLRNIIKENYKQKLPAGEYENEYWLRWTIALAPLIFAFVGIPIGIMAGKGGKAIGFGMSLVVIFVYYMLLVVALNLGEKNIVPSRYIMWLPNVVMGIAGIILFSKMVKK